jgi:hypothetical protein
MIEGEASAGDFLWAWVFSVTSVSSVAENRKRGHSTFSGVGNYLYLFWFLNNIRVSGNVYRRTSVKLEV